MATNLRKGFKREYVSKTAFNGTQSIILLEATPAGLRKRTIKKGLNIPMCEEKLHELNRKIPINERL